MKKPDFLLKIKQALDHKGIGRRLLLHIIIFSSLVTLGATAVQLYTDYKRDVGLIKGRLDDIKSSHLVSISASLWNLDVNQLRLQLQGIRHLPDVDAVAIYESPGNVVRPLAIEIGEFRKDNTIIREYPVFQSFTAEPSQIGVLKVQASLQAVYARLWDKAVVILLSQGVKTFLVSMFILYLFYQQVAVHLSAIAQHLSRYRVAESGSRLRLSRKQPKEKDELNQLVDAFNTLTDDLVVAYDELRALNMELERDVAARIQAEEEVHKLNSELEMRVRRRTSELEAANDELASFCYSVSHDLRAPLRRIEGFRRILEERIGTELSDRARHYLDRIQEGTQLMSEMIDSFLQLSRATQNEMNVVPMNLSELVTKLLDELAQNDPERSVDIHIDPDLTDEADQRFMTMLMSNLLSNAWKYSSKAAQARIEFGSYQEDSGQRIYYVRDNGAGFDMKYADRLFSPFTRLHTADEFEGVGIGLATVQRIVARHGGHIWAEAEPGCGATFFFTLWESKLDIPRDTSEP